MEREQTSSHATCSRTEGREKQVNLYLHLQQLSEESDFKNEWMFVESRPIQAGERNVCLCGKTPIKTYFFLVNKISGKRTFVGSTCIKNIAPEAAAVISYFEYILQHGIQGTYKGQDKHGLQIFTVKAKTKIVSSLPIVKHLNPPVQENQEGEWQLTVMFPQTESLLVGQKYWLNLKAKHRQSYILSKFHKIVDKIMLKCISAPEAADPTIKRVEIFRKGLMKGQDGITSNVACHAMLWTENSNEHPKTRDQQKHDIEIPQNRLV